MKKVQILLLFIFMYLSFSVNVAAKESPVVEIETAIIGTEGNIINIEDNSKYMFFDGENTLFVLGLMKEPFEVREGIDIIGEGPLLQIYVNREIIKGKFAYPNYDNMRIGKWNLEWVFTPEDSNYPIVKGYTPLNVVVNEELKQERAVEAIALTKNKLSLQSNDTFDINLKSKVTGSKYTWTTSNKKIATVNKKNGIVTAVKKGKAVITCKVTLPDGSVKTLKCNVTVK